MIGSLMPHACLTVALLLSGGLMAWGQKSHRSLSSGEASLEPVRAAYQAGRNREVVLLADQAIAELSGAAASGKVLSELHFWRGASLRRLERHDEALIALDTSHRMGLRIPELYLERALIRRALKQDQEAEADYQEAERLLPLDDERRLSFAEHWKRKAQQTPLFQLTLTPQVGFDSNIMGLEKDAPLADGDAEENSPYYGLVFGLKYFLVRNEAQLLALEYRNQMRAFVDDSELNYTDNLISGVGRQPFLDGADLEFRATLGEAISDGEGHLRTTRTIAPAVLLELSLALYARLWGDWTDADYYISGLPTEQDRDGTIVRGGVVFGIDLGAGWSVAPHLGVAEYDTDGVDFDHVDLVVGLALSTREYVGCVFSPSISYTRADYDHANSVSGFTEKREDRIWRLALTVTFRGIEKLIGYAPSVTISYLDHASSIGAYDYSRWEPRVEMTIVAMTF